MSHKKPEQLVNSLKKRKVGAMNRFFASKLLPLIGLLTATSPALADPLATHTCTNSAGVPTNLTATTPSSDFVVVGDAEDGIVRHLATGLEWRRCPFGQTFSAGSCSGSSNSRNWQTALQEAETLGAGWRVPNINELASIVEECTSAPAINEVVFPGTSGSSSYWTSTTEQQYGGGYALVINFSTGSDQTARSKTLSTPFMLVRDAD